MTTALVAAVAGLLGIALGAWLNSLFATGKERWEFKRELYCRLIYAGRGPVRIEHPGGGKRALRRG